MRPTNHGQAEISCRISSFLPCECSVAFCSTPQCVSSLVVMLLPQVRTAFTTSCGNRKMCGSMVLSGFWRLLQSGSSRLDRALLAYRIYREVFLQKRGVSMMDTEPMISSTQWAPHYQFSKTARLGSSLNTIFPLARSSRIQIFVSTNFHSFDSFDILSTRFVVRECICGDFLFTEMSANVHFWSGSHQFPGCSYHFRGVLRIVSHSCPAFPGRTLFPDAIKAFFERRLLRLLLLLLLLCSPNTL